MKRKMIFGAVVVFLFFVQAQTVFAQDMSFQLLAGAVWDRSNGNSINIANRIQAIGVQVKNSGMGIIIQFKDGSTQSYALIDIDEVDDGYGRTTWSNVRMVNPNTGVFFPEHFTAITGIDIMSNIFQFHIINSQGAIILQAGGTMRFI